MAIIYQNGIQYSGSGDPLIYDDMGGATSTTGGVHGLVPAPSAGDNEKFLSGDGSWKSIEESVTKTASGNPIDVSDSASAPLVKCVSAITGSQDLHGYDKPWVGGAGKNKWPFGDFTGPHTDVPYSLPAGTYTVSKLDDNTPAAIRFMGGGMSELVTFRSSTTFTLTEASTTINYSCDSGTATNVMIESGSTATAYEPYSNICPITAYTEGEIVERGKNLISEIEQNTYNADGTTYVSTKRCRTPIFKLRSGSTYVFSFSTSNTSKNIRVVYQIWANDSYTNNQIIEESQNKTSPFTITPQNDIWISLSFKYTDDSNITPSEITAQGEKGTTPTDYEPYVGTTHTTTFPSAIYRGSEDVVKGEVTTEWIKVKLKDLTWTYLAANKFFYATNGGKKSGLLNIISNTFKTEDVNWGGSVNEGAICGNLSNATIYIQTALYDNVSDFVSWLTTLDAEAAFELATPTTSSVTPTNLPIKSLSGYSHIESSTGDMEIEYIAKAFSPITEIVDSQISALQKMMELMLTSARETEMVASANYTAGTLIVACGALYKATTAISSGASLVVGTNITPTTIAAEIAALA